MATQPNWWESAPLAPANDPSFTGYIPGTPKPKEPKSPVFVPQGATQMFNPNTNTYEAVPGVPGADDKDAIKNAINGLSLEELLTSVGRARDNLKSGWATGVWGKLAEIKPGGGTPRDDFLGNLSAIQGGIINEKLQALKDASKTGASGLGALSEKEGERLASSVAALSPNMSPEAYQKSFKEIARHAKTLAAIRDGKNPNDPAVAKQIEAEAEALSRISEASPKPSLLNAPLEASAEAAGVTNLSDEQKRAYDAFLAANPNPDGSSLNTFLTTLTGKTVTNGDQIAKAIKQGRGVNTAVQDLSYRDKLRSRIAAEDKMGLGVDPATTLATQGGTLSISDEAAGVGNALAGIVSAPFTGKFDPAGDYRFGRDEERMRIADARQQLGYGGTAIEFASGAASAAPTAALAALSGKAAAVAAGKAGLAGGALSGFGVGEGTNQSLAGLGLGAAAGGALGRYAPAAVERVLPRRFRASPELAHEVAAAADRQNVSLIRPMVDDNALAKFADLKGTANAGPTIEAGANRVRGDIEKATVRLGQGGNSTNREAQGEALREIAKTVQSSNREGTTAAYEAARQVQPDAQVDPATMRQTIDAKLQQLSLRPNQNGAEMASLRRYRADLDKPLPLQEIRNMRTNAYDNVYGGATSRTAEQRRADRFMMGVIDGANQDIEAALTPEALAAYKAADAQHAENRTFYKQAFKPLFGDTDGDLSKLSAEQIHSRFKRALNTNGAAIAAFHRRMPLEASRDFAATIAETLGRSAADEPFDAQIFLNQTKDFSPSAMRTLFGPGGEQSIGDLRLLSRKLLDTGAEKTGDATRAGYLERQSWRQLARAFLGGVTGLVKGPAGVAAGGATAAGGYSGGLTGAGVAAATAATVAGGREVSRVLSARAMTNPRVARWLASAADISSHKAASEATRKLSVIIAREPALSHELRPIYDFLENRLAQPLAADPKQSGGANDQQQ
jgi:cytochrome c556